MKYLGEIQFGRELAEDEVLRINYILKRRATRYVAASQREWLFPEARVPTTDWRALDDDLFLLPHVWKVGFSGESTQEMIELRRSRRMNTVVIRGNAVSKTRDSAISNGPFTSDRAKSGLKKRAGKPRAMVDQRIGRHNFEDKMMDEFLQSEITR